MSPEAQTIAIAEALGWTQLDPPKDLGWGASAPNRHWYFIHQLPDYLTDRNALWPALAHLDDDQWLEFMLSLSDACRTDPYNTDRWTLTRALLEATPAQIAEAFLRTLHLWTP